MTCPKCKSSTYRESYWNGWIFYSCFCGYIWSQEEF